MSTSPVPAATNKSRRLYLIGCLAAVVVVCICLVLVGGLGGFAYIARTRVVQGLATPARAPTLGRTPSPSGGTRWPIVIRDNFADNANGWNIPAKEPEVNSFGTFREVIANDRFRIEADVSISNDRDIHVHWPKMRPLSDFELTVNAQRISGDEGALDVVVFRRDERGNFYEFELDGDRSFAIELCYQNACKSLIDTTPSDAIQNGGVNRLKVMAQGSHFSFFINDQHVVDVNDNTLPTGVVALGVDMSVAFDDVVEFSAFELRAPR